MARKASRPVAVERVRVRWWMLVEREEGRAVEVIWGVGLGGMFVLFGLLCCYSIGIRKAMLGTLVVSDVDCLAFEGALPLCAFPATVEPKAREDAIRWRVYIRYQIDCCPLRDRWHSS